jgi:purine-binding chemotaxis protein CheW
MTLTKQYSTFYIDDLMFGIEVGTVQEIIRYQTMTPVPLASPIVRGLINLRGQIVTAIDLRRRLGLADRENEKEVPPMNVVIRIQDEVISLLVDQIGDVIETDNIPFERAPETLDPVIKQVVSGIYKLDGKLLLTLNAEQTIDLRAIH